LRWVWLAAWLLAPGHWPIDCGPSPTIEPGNGLKTRKMTMTKQEQPWLRQDDESPSLKPGSLENILSLRDPKRVVFLYVIGIALLIMGSLYSIWRMSLLSSFQAQAWEYMRERDQRWEQHARDQAELSREILRRLPQR
jgi:hypothetical protein